MESDAGERPEIIEDIICHLTGKTQLQSTLHQVYNVDEPGNEEGRKYGLEWKEKLRDIEPDNIVKINPFATNRALLGVIHNLHRQRLE